uniref:Uncharacterized protein n=3 Tax=Oryza TaxID=4527 RepID=A0A0D3H752_9ORYZ
MRRLACSSLTRAGPQPAPSPFSSPRIRRHRRRRRRRRRSVPSPSRSPSSATPPLALRHCRLTLLLLSSQCRRRPPCRWINEEPGAARSEDPDLAGLSRWPSELMISTRSEGCHPCSLLLFLSGPPLLLSTLFLPLSAPLGGRSKGLFGLL